MKALDTHSLIQHLTEIDQQHRSVLQFEAALLDLLPFYLHFRCQVIAFRSSGPAVMGCCAQKPTVS
jgi:hypothetical protein